MTQRNEPELASIMRKLVEDGDVGLHMQDGVYAMTVGYDTQVLLTPIEAQALDETMTQLDNTEAGS